MNLERLVYSTVVLMSVLVVYDGWSQLTTFAGIAVVIIAPTLALGVAHLFADILSLQAQRRRLLREGEWRELLSDQVSTAAAAAPPLLILLVGWLTPADAVSTMVVLIWTGLASLVVLAGFSAFRTGLRGWRLVAAGAVGGLVGLIVISLQILLKPH